MICGLIKVPSLFLLLLIKDGILTIIIVLIYIVLTGNEFLRINETIWDADCYTNELLAWKDPLGIIPDVKKELLIMSLKSNILFAYVKMLFLILKLYQRVN